MFKTIKMVLENLTKDDQDDLDPSRGIFNALILTAFTALIGLALAYFLIWRTP